jgi:3-hydroxybutyryl-CoA dehydrogenase
MRLLDYLKYRWHKFQLERNPAPQIPLPDVAAIERVLVLGAGTMGQQIAWQCAVHGYQVALYDVDEAALQTAVSQIDRFAAAFVEEGRLDESEAAAAQARIFSYTDPAAAADAADLLSESTPEDPALKGKALAQFDVLCPERTIFTTNTSTLLPSMFAMASGRPARLAALHFHLPVWEANVVDVMPHAGTAAGLPELLRQFALRIGQIPIVLEKESSGYVFNAMLSALNRSALTLAANGVSTPEDVDRAWMAIMKTEIGPFGIQDLVGLDTVWKITDYWGRTLRDEQLQKNAALLRRYLDRGHLGRKSGQGFYTYPDPAFADPDFVDAAASLTAEE